jgi:putative transferase (TIGR04331 family)
MTSFQTHLHLTMLKIPSSVEDGARIVTIESFIPELRNSSEGRNFYFVAMESPWLKRSQTHRDFKKIQFIYNTNLPKMVQYLKKIHKTYKYDSIFWNTLISPWLVTMLMSVFIKQKTVDRALKDYDINSYSVLLDYESFLRFDSDEKYTSFYRFDENWNFAQYTIILQCENGNLSNATPVECSPCIYNSSNETKKNSIFVNIVQRTSLFFLKLFPPKIVFYAAYLDTISLIRLELLLGQFPFLFIRRFYNVGKKKYNRQLLEDIEIDGHDAGKAMSIILKSTLPLYAVEEFDDIHRKVILSNLPINPKIIITATALWYDSFFKFYVAYVRQHSPSTIVGIIQHGGSVGIIKSGVVDYEYGFCDYYFTWGEMSDDNNPHKIRFGIPKKSHNIKKSEKLRKTHVLIVRSWQPKHTQKLTSEIDTDIDYLKDSVAFANKLNKKILNEHLLIRLFPEQKAFGSSIPIANNEEKYWRENYSNINLDKSSNINELYSRSRIVVYTYLIGTGYVECLANNIPTIIISRHLDSIVSAEFEMIAEKLKQYNVLFDNPESAARHINNVFDDVDRWWNQEGLQTVLSEFNNKYAYKLDNRINSFAKTINYALSKKT